MDAVSVIDVNVWDVTVNGTLTGVTGGIINVRYNSASEYGSLDVLNGFQCPLDWVTEDMQVLTLKIAFIEPLPPNNFNKGIDVTRLYSSTMCTSGFLTATWADNSVVDSKRCVTDISVNHRRLNGDYIFPFEVDAEVMIGGCPAKGLSVVVIAVIIVCCIIVLLAVVGVFVYLRYRKRYAQGSFNKQFERDNRTTMESRKASVLNQ